MTWSQLMRFTMLVAAATVLIPHCGSCGGSGNSRTDRDNDGYYAGDGAGYDCDDGNADINPGADEACDGIDNDCDGEIDGSKADGAKAYYPDNDGDGYGEMTEATSACSAPAGSWVENNRLDCDDSDSAVNPGAEEACDGVDNDCDEMVDEFDDTTAADAAGADTYYEDADGDGYGLITSTLRACSAPTSGWALADGDCDDTNPYTFPGADEICDGEANDCLNTAFWTSVDEDGLLAFRSSTGDWTIYDPTDFGDSSAPGSATITDDGTLYACTGTFYGAFTVSGGQVTVDAADDAMPTFDGGGSVTPFTVTDGGQLTAEDITIANGDGNQGGGLVCDGGDGVTLADVTFSGNSAGTGGAAWLSNCAFATFDDVAFDSNHASQAGGGIWMADSSVSILGGSEFDDTSSYATDGTASTVYVQGASTLDLGTMTFGEPDHSKSTTGGAVVLEGSDYLLKSSRFTTWPSTGSVADIYFPGTSTSYNAATGTPVTCANGTCS